MSLAMYRTPKACRIVGRAAGVCSSGYSAERVDVCLESADSIATRNPFLGAGV